MVNYIYIIILINKSGVQRILIPIQRDLAQIRRQNKQEIKGKIE
jgi:hypothetical protein